MQWTELKNEWKAVQPKVKTKWPKLTDAELKAIAGNRKEMITHIQKHYPGDKAKIEKEIESFITGLKAHV